MVKRKLDEAGIGDKNERAGEENLARIRKQIEYYFGDFNLPFDNFINKAMEQNDGWFPTQTLLKFKKLQTLEADNMTIIEAVKESELLELNEEQTKFKPKNEPKTKAWVQERTIQAMGFPKAELVMDDLVLFWKGVCSEVQKVSFCGRSTGVLNVAFSTKELAMEYAKGEHKVEYKGKELTLGQNIFQLPSQKR